MKLVYWLAPTLGLAAFAGYYQLWDQPEVVICKDEGGRRYLDPYEEYAHRDGRKEAKADLARGTPKLLTYGLPARWTMEFGQILQRDYGVERRTLAGCMVSNSLVKYVDDYDQVIEQHLKDRYGSDVMDQAIRKAEALYAEHHPAVKKPRVISG